MKEVKLSVANHQPKPTTSGNLSLNCFVQAMKRTLTLCLFTWLSLSCKPGDWSNRSGELYYAWLFGLIATADGGYLIGVTRYHTISASGANQYDPASTFGDLMLIKTDAQGNRLWATVLGKPGGQDGVKLIQLPNGNYLLAGNTVSIPPANLRNHIDVVLTEIGPDGQERSNGRVDNPGFELVLTDLGNGPAGSLFAAGSQWKLGVEHDWLTRISQNGSSTQWGYVTPDSTKKRTSTQTLDVAPDGDLFVAGYKSLNGAAQTYFRRISPDGSIRWTQYAIDTLQLTPRQLYATADGGFLLTGSAYPTALATIPQVVLLKADANGRTQSIQWFNLGPYLNDDQHGLLSKRVDGAFVLAIWQQGKITLTALDRNGGSPKTIPTSTTLYGFKKPLFLALANGETILVEFTGSIAYEREITMHRISSNGNEIWHRVIASL